MFDMLDGLGKSLLASKLGTCDQVMCAICKLRCLRRVCLHSFLIYQLDVGEHGAGKEKEKELSPPNPLGGQ